MTRPVIGIPSPRKEGEILPRYEVTGDYIEQTERAGGVPVMLPITPNTPSSQLDEWISLCGGILLPGGGDIDCSLYGQERSSEQPACSPADRAWQELELELIRRAAVQGKPMLGICLGIQALAVAFGGSLVQDIPSQIPGCLPHHQPMEQRALTTHTVAVKPGTMLFKISGLSDNGILSVNSYHHQAVIIPPPGFDISAVASDGIIEALENPEKHILGVQWHPENLAAVRPEAFALFQWLIEQAQQA